MFFKQFATLQNVIKIPVNRQQISNLTSKIEKFIKKNKNNLASKKKKFIEGLTILELCFLLI
jgi:hypothetical protein